MMLLHTLTTTYLLLAVAWSSLAVISGQDTATNDGTSINNKNDNDWFTSVSINVHMNGDPDPCGTTQPVTSEVANSISFARNKYEMESSLTDGIASILDKDTSRCHELGDKIKSLYSFCDRGPDVTPILLDHQDLVKTQQQTLPCRWYTREGLRISTMEQLQSLAEKAKKTSTSPSCANPQDGGDCDEEMQDASDSATTDIHLYAVPAGRVFIFAPAYVGEIFRLDHLKLLPDVNKPIYLEVLSTRPKVLDILNVFTPEEADEVVRRALAETSPTHKIKRSTTGTTENSVFSKRTSENGFDTHGKVALALKKRIFEVLGYDEYWNGHDDGLQVLRYNTSQAYIQHDDYLSDPGKRDSYDYKSAGKGGNRYATVLLYMTDLPEGAGGETVFSKAWPEDIPEHERKNIKTAISELRETGDAARAGIEEGSWEEQMVALCRSRFSVKPHAGRAVLFYSQTPNGQKDPMAQHGGCPVLTGTKWAANLWIWNTPRRSFKGAPMRDDVDPATLSDNMPKQLVATWKNTGEDPAMANAVLYYDEAQYWGQLGPNDKQLRANTYEGHRWNVKVDDKVVKTFVIGKEPKQEFKI